MDDVRHPERSSSSDIKKMKFENTSVDIIHQGDTITGITVVDDKMYVVLVTIGPPKVNVINLKSYWSIPPPSISIAYMKNPVGLAGCPYNKVLYISDHGLNSIHRVNITDNSVKRWSVRENYKPLGLSVTSEHNVLVTVQIRDTEGESRVVEYTSEGQLIREIKLDRSIDYAHQTLELSTDQFIICHGVRRERIAFYVSSLRRVCLINSEGKIIKCFGGEGGEDEDQLHLFHSLAIDKNRQVVFVADRNRVVMLDYEMNFLGLVQSSERLARPTRLYFDLNSDQLIVGDDGWSGHSRLLLISPDRSVTE